MSEQCKIKRWDLLKSKLKNLSVKEVDAFLAKYPKAVIIDCRKKHEFQAVRLPQAIHIDYLAYDFWEKIDQLPRAMPYLLYCNSCRRSTRASTLMQNGGFTNVFNLEGGLNNWIAEQGETGLLKNQA